MRVFVGWVIALGLVALPAMAGRPRDGKDNAADASKTKDANNTKPAAGGKTDTAAKTDSTNFATEVQQLRDLILSQSKELESTREQLQQDQHRIELLENALKTSHEAPAATTTPSTSVLVTPAVAIAPNSATTPAAAPLSHPGSGAEEQKSPLSFRIGGAEFTPGGFMDFTSIYRTTNTGNLGTSFGAIPFSNTVAGHLTEERFMVSNSRISMKVTEKFGKNDVTGYYEMDFLGNDAANVFVTSNSHTFRSRLYFVDVKRDKFEIAAGQMWSWLTPNRVGVSPMPADIFYSQNMDTNYQVGLTWTRAPQFRLVYHPNEHWALGVALENPEQYTGLNNEVTFPSFFNAQLAGQFDAANNSSTPNLHPDVIPKISYDTDLGGKHFHAEAAGLLSSIKITDLAQAIPTPSGFTSHTKTGGGISGAVNLEFLKNVRFVGNGFWSDGGGRYIFGLGPDAVVRPVNASGNTCTVVGPPPGSATGCDAQISLVHAGSGIVGIEAQVTPTTMFAGYFGGAYFQRDSFPDITRTPGVLPHPCGGLTSPATLFPCVGFGGSGSATSNNRAITEPSFDWIQTFWKNPQYGALQLITEASYVVRSPWFVAAGAPKNAHLTMVWLDLRYVLP